MIEMRELLPLGPMARYLGVKPAWLRGEAEAGRVPAVRAGETYLFNVVALERALLERAGQVERTPATAGGLAGGGEAMTNGRSSRESGEVRQAKSIAELIDAEIEALGLLLEERLEPPIDDAGGAMCCSKRRGADG